MSTHTLHGNNAVLAIVPRILSVPLCFVWFVSTHDQFYLQSRQVLSLLPIGKYNGITHEKKTSPDSLFSHLHCTMISIRKYDQS